MFPLHYEITVTLNAAPEAAFAYLDDLATFGARKYLNYVELLSFSALRRLGLRYPENCLLGIYRKQV